ncbi:MAG TPA: AAA-associated domain-containing protein [Thermoplasmata archaeon]|nr:AAA-associated domain-containing protein [Thermoplasmata archaeon]
MATTYPKCSPTEMLGLLVLLNDHKGSEDVARLADDLDLEIDEIFPALEYAELLQFVKVSDGRATFTDLGKKLVAASIRERKAIVREQLKRTALFRTILRALEANPEHRLTDEEFGHIIAFTTARADGGEQNIVNWGRYADLFRYDADAHVVCPARRSTYAKGGGGRTPPPPSSGSTNDPAGGVKARAEAPETARGPGTASAVA